MSTNNRVLATRVDAKGETVGGLAIPDNAKKKPLEAPVVAVGTFDGEDRIILREDDVLAIVVEESGACAHAF